MKIAGVLFLLLACGSLLAWTKKRTPFVAKKISKSADFIANGPVSTVFPLFGAFEERKVVYGWDPVLIYPEKEVIEEGTTFKIYNHGHKHRHFGEREALWRVSKYDPENYLVQYLVSTPNRYWTVTVKCEPVNDEQTKTTVTYTYIGLNNRGNKLNEMAAEAMYKYNLKDWEQAANYYLETGKQINAPDSTKHVH